MPLAYLRILTGRARTQRSNRHLARYLAFIAGAVNAGGFLALHQYTSHMTGIVSAMADNLAAGNTRLLLDGLAAVGSFLLGAATTALIIRFARRHHLESEYALPLILEAALLVVFGFEGHEFEGHSVLGTVVLLCFTMGLQNAMITKISGAVIRTTHLTGMITDLGIKLGRALDALMTGMPIAESIEASKFRLLLSMVGLFFAGGVVGAVGFKHAGFLFTIPLAAMLALMAMMPVADDFRSRRPMA